MGCNSGKVSAPAGAAPKTPPAQQNTLLTTPAATSSLKNFNDGLQDFCEKHPEQEVAAVDGTITPRGFNGTWSSGAVIDDNGPMASTRKSVVTWSDGVVSIAQISDTTTSGVLESVIELTYNGMAFRGELGTDDAIHWSDGDVWTRHPDQGLAEGRASMEVPAASNTDKEPEALRVSEGCGLTAAIDAAVGADSKDAAGTPVAMKDPVAVRTASDQMRAEAEAKAESKSKQDWRSGQLDRISIDTADMDKEKLAKKSEAAGMTLNTSKPEVKPPRREKGMCCC